MAGKVDAGLFSQIDMRPTLLGLVDLPIPSRLDGVSRTRRLSGDTSDAPHAVVCEDTYLTMLRTEQAKLVHYAGKDYGELYDLTSDPDELENLFHRPDSSAIRSRLETQLLHMITTSAYRHGGHKTGKRADYSQPTDRVIG